MLIEEYKSIFIHIPKTGGTSIGNIIHPNHLVLTRPRNSLGKRYSDITLGENHHVAEHQPWGHYKDLLLKQNILIKDYFVFTFVRNPYDRMYSAYKFVTQKLKQNHPFIIGLIQAVSKKSINYWSGLDFNSFLLEIERNNILYTFNQKQTFFAKKNQCNFIGRFENFNQDILYVLNKLNIGNTNIPHLNKTSNKFEYKEKYNLISTNIIRYYFKEDFIEFDYDFNIL